MSSVAVIGASGNFGRRIVAALLADGIPVIAAGRQRTKLEALRTRLGGSGQLTIDVCDSTTGLNDFLDRHRPAILVNASGPFQQMDYRAPLACIDQGIHYIDLADGRTYVREFSALDERAQNRGVVAITGASTVPTLSSAVLDMYQSEFAAIDSLRYGISPGLKTERGLATTQSVLSYVGKKLAAAANDGTVRYGWGDLYRQYYPGLGNRWMGNCEIPDLDLLPGRHGLKRIQFSAGMENSLLHFGIWIAGWLVRLGVPLDLPRHAALMLRASHCFDQFGTDNGGMHMVIEGRSKQNLPLRKEWFIIARDGDGPQIPAVPAILLARRLFHGERIEAGARACIGLITLKDYLAKLAPYKIDSGELR